MPRLIDARVGGHRVRRWDNVVHLVKAASGVTTVELDGSGYVLSPNLSFVVTMHCGRKAKMHAHGSNRYTDDPITCMGCASVP